MAPTPPRRGTPPASTSRSILLASSVIACALIAATAWIGWRDYTNLRAQAGTGLVQHTRMLVSHTERALDATDLTLKTLINRFKTVPWDEVVNTTATHQALSQAEARLPHVGAVWLVDQNGYLRGLDASRVTPDLDLFDRQYWRAHAIDRHDGPYFSEPLRDRLGQRSMSVMSLPIYVRQHSFRGVIAASLTPTYYLPVLSSNHGCQGCENALVRADGRPIVATQKRTETLAQLREAIRQEISDGTGDRELFEFTTETGTTLVTIQPSQRFSIAVVGMLREQSILQQWFHRETPIFGLAGAALLLLTFGAWKLSRSAATQEQHARELGRTARELAGAKAEAERQQEAESHARQEAAEANRAKSDFLAVMSHELRTPLNAILGFSEIIADRSFGPHATDRYSAYAKDIQISGQHLLSLINDILDLSKIEAGRYQITPEAVALDKSVADCLKLVQQRHTGNDVHFDIEVGNIEIWADPRALKQILLNLIGNAAKFTQQGQIVVRAWDLGDSVQIHVADTGPGMTAEQITLALQPFRQVDRSLARRHDGTGLGLTIVDRLVRLHGGSIEIDSAPQQGTRITLSFPRRPPSPQTTREHQTAQTTHVEPALES
ncbi:sensor histidine kinase [Rhodovibrio salinarum]|uniref:histidine kinase n=1 Tax=Rhodovibrio salinarum TaxID=1087 RepID=A0A934V0E1_9PROT|nr:ATP-binding protein [Rhodovibrio salinarum]MBK1697526.1 sensor histidine kinase [Rhodovibrio salinarum]